MIVTNHAALQIAFEKEIPGVQARGDNKNIYHEPERRRKPQKHAGDNDSGDRLEKSYPFGETPKGILVFTPDGHFAQIHVASDVPRIASNNRLTGTAEEYQAIMRRSISVFGTYTVDAERKTVTYRIVSSSFPNWEGEAQTRVINKLTAEEFQNTNPNVAGGRGSALNRYQRVK